MHTNWFRLIVILTILALLGGTTGITSPAYAAVPQADSGPHITVGGPQTESGPIRVISPSAMGKLESLSAVEAREPSRAEIERAAKIRELTNRSLARPKSESSPTDSSIIQNAPVGSGMPSAIANFEGTNNVNGVLPPDTNGDIGWDPNTGTKYYMQWVNLSFQIWNVTNPAAPTSLYGPAAGNSLFTSLGGICASNNDGDPIVLFDQLANRWMVSQFALGFPNNFHQCIAVSATANPTGSWYLYDFQTSTVNMNDYPHFGVWPDGYYMTVNQFNGSSFNWAGAGVAVFERDQMLAGLPARMIYIDVGTVTLNYGGMLPSDLDGPVAPPPGTPNYFAEWDDSTWIPPSDALRIWEFSVDWVTPANTTFGANSNFDPNYVVNTTNVDPEVCAGFTRNCIPQPATTAKLDAISDRLMFRLAYRNFGTHETLVGNHTVDAGGDQAAVHWFELRDSGSGWGMYQEGVYAPDTDHRWMGSIAQDASGNMALGYSVSSTSTYPSIRYTGRLAADPLNTLPQGETTLVAGAGSQTHSSSRWGDYSMMSVDPEDDCTFWYTQEYYAATSAAGWQTRIGSFTFPTCAASAVGTLAGTVTDSGANPIANATISISGGYTTTTDTSGQYTILLPAGTYDVTASKYGYLDGTATGVVITAGNTTTQNFTLNTAPNYTVTLNVVDATTGWPLYASVTISGYPGGSVFTDPVTGSVTISLVQGTHLFTFHALSGGYNDLSDSIPITSNTIITATLSADLASCAAPGYSTTGFTTGFTENFETWPLPNWTVLDNAGNGIVWGPNTATNDSNYTGGAGLAATANSDSAGTAEFDTELISPVINTSSLPHYTLLYLANYQNYASLDYLELDIKVDSNPWINILSWNEDHGTIFNTPGELVSIDLTSFLTGSSTFQLRWHYYDPNTNDWDWYAQIDDVRIGANCTPVPGAGLVVGSVFDANTSALVPGASVQSGTVNAVMIDASADSNTPDEVYVIGLPSGSQNITASKTPYASVTNAVNVTAASTVGHNFYLPVGQLSISPSSLTFNVPVNGTDNAPAVLSNTGGLAASFSIYALNGTPPTLSPTGPFAPNTRHIGPKNLNDTDSQKLRIRPLQTGISPLAAGDVVTSWNTGLTYAWGIGFNTTANDLWLGNIAAAGGDDKDYRFTTTGTNTGDSIDVSGTGGVFMADMTYNPFTNKLWQVNVGGDNCIYELDPVTLTLTGSKICPAFGTSQRGLAYDPVSDTYFAGSWNDFIINRFKPDGTLLSAVDVALEISGLAYNPVTQHLFVLSNTDSTTPGTTGSYDITVLDASIPGTYTVVGGFNIMNGVTPVFGNTFGQAGLEIDCSGNLWVVNKDAQQVYVAQSGETGVCNWQADWLSVSPTSGSVNAGSNTSLTVYVNAAGKTAGTYQGYLRISSSDTPYGFVNLPVTMNVIAGAIPDPWVGGVAIQADQSIAAVGRPHLGSQIASYIGSSAGSTTQYVPMLFKDAFGGGSYKSALYIQNLSANPANLTIEFVNDSGTTVHTITEPLAANASKGYWLSSIAGLGASFVGGAKVTADQPILAVGRPHIGSEVMTYNGISAGSTTAWLPMFFKNGFSSYNAALYIQNLTSNTANLTIEYLNLDGTVACTDNDTLPAKASKGYWSLLVTCDSGSLPSGFVGGVKVTSSDDILAVGRVHLGSQITTYNGFSGGAATAYVPMLFRKAFSGTYNAALYLQNVSSASASVTIEYRDNAGAIAATQNVTLDPGAISSIWLPSVAGLPDGFAGAAFITADQNIIAVGRPHLGSEITAYNGAPAGSATTYLPMLFKNAFSAPYNAAFYIQNTSANTASVSIFFYDDAGALSCVKGITLAPYATKGFWMPAVTCGP